MTQPTIHMVNPDDTTKITRRCQSVTRHGKQCQKPKAHNADMEVVHQHGAIFWRNLPPNDNLAEAKIDTEPTQTPEFNAMEAELRGWWFDQAEAEIDGTVKKAIEYSSTDLLDLGRTLAYCMGRTVSDEEAEELGVFFYLQGKMSRWAGAIKSGRRVSDDTLFDISVYTRMAQRIRHAGNWPGVNDELAGGSTLNQEDQ